MNLSDRSPYPIRYTVRPLTELLHLDYFADADEATMSQKKGRSGDVAYLCKAVVTLTTIRLRSDRRSTPIRLQFDCYNRSMTCVTTAVGCSTAA